MTRPRFLEKKVYLLGTMQRDIAKQIIDNCPLDKEQPLEVVIREKTRSRKLDQNALMWAGPLKDIAEQVWIDGKQFSDVVFHEHFKREHLPEEFDPELCKEGYRKWDVTPSGERVLVGSTGDLTVKGFSQYLEQVYAFGASHGVQFTARLSA